MHPRERLDYSPIDRRPPLRFPEGIRLVVWPLLALEEWDLSRPMARMVISPPQGQPQLPDLPNWSWHEYGMRVGFWRLKKMLERLGISPTVTLNAKVCETYPQVIEACIDNGWELNAHSYDQVPMHKLDDQRATINKSMDIIEKFSGRRPPRHARLPRRSRHRIYRRLGTRRRAGDAQDRTPPRRRAPLQFRDS
jgi:allantoinase